MSEHENTPAALISGNLPSTEIKEQQGRYEYVSSILLTILPAKPPPLPLPINIKIEPSDSPAQYNYTISHDNLQAEETNPFYGINGYDEPTAEYYADVAAAHNYSYGNNGHSAYSYSSDGFGATGFTKPMATVIESIDPDIFFKKGRFLHDVFARHLLNNYGVAKVNELLCIYTKDKYSTTRKDFNKVMLTVIPSLTGTQRNEVFEYLDITCERYLEMSPSNFIGLKSYIYDINTDAFFYYSDQFVIPNRIHFDYNPGVYSKIMDDALNSFACGDINVRMLLEEMIGLCLYRGTEFVRAFLLLGNGSNGKTTLLELILALLGQENCSSISLHDLDKKFENTSIVGKLVNLGDDISNTLIQDTSVFKRLTSGQPVTLQDKYGQPFDYRNYATLIFSGNDQPRANDKSKGFHRRWIILPLNAVFGETTIPNFDPDYHTKLMTAEALEYLLACAIRGLKRLLTTKRFTSCTSAIAEQKAYEALNNPLISFIEQVGDISNLPTDTVFDMYKQWAEQGNIPKVYNKIEFGRQLKRQVKYKSVPNKDPEGNSIRYYVKDESTTTIVEAAVTDGYR